MIKKCICCAEYFNSALEINETIKNFYKRKYCFKCSPCRNKNILQKEKTIFFNGKIRSTIYNIDYNTLLKITTESSSLSVMLRKLKYQDIRISRKTLKNRLKEFNIDYEKILLNIKNNEFDKCNRDPNKYFIENDKKSRSSIRKTIIKNNIINYICEICKNGSIWNGKLLSLHLDHLNGINNDNRLENLRFLCPNCHSQTFNYTGKSIGLKHKKLLFQKINRDLFCECIKNNKMSDISKILDISHQDISFLIKYYNLDYIKKNKGIKRKRKFEVSKEELEKLIKEIPMTKIGKMFGVSDNAIKKRAKLLGVKNIEKSK